MISLLIFFIVLSILVLIHELGHFIVAKKSGVFVEEFGLGLPPRLFGKKIGETIYSINWLPFGGFVKVYGEEAHETMQANVPPEKADQAFVNKHPLTKIAILTAGVFFNFLLGWVIISYLFTQGVPVPTNRVLVEQVVDNSPAQKAGLRKGDIIQSVTYENQTTKLQNTEDLVATTQKYGDREVMLTVQSHGQTKTTIIIPRKNPPKNQGSLGVVISSVEIKKYSLLEAPFLGLYEAVRITGFIVRELVLTVYRLVTLQKAKVDVAGPVGIYFVTKTAAEAGYNSLLQLVSILSLNLAVINILPFPALDGGRVAVVLYEWILRRKVNPMIERRLNVAGLTILIALILLITIHDILKLLVK